MYRLNSKSWRYISLSNTTSKLLEKILTNLITARVEKTEILKKKQFRSRKGQSMIYLVLSAVRQIRELHKRGKDAMMVTMNIVSTFPSLKPKFIRKQVVEVARKEEE